MTFPYYGSKAKPTASKRLFYLLALFLFTFRLQAQPVITSFSPSSGPIGTMVTIHGANFNTSVHDNIVYFGAVKATVLSASATLIKVTVPAGATYQPITVTANRLTTYATRPFIVTAPAPYHSFSVNSFTPKHGFATPAYPNFILNGDLDGDSKPDLITLNLTDNTLSVFRNNGKNSDLSFGPAVNYAAGTSPFGGAVGDLDGDGMMDVVIGDYGNHKLVVYRNAGIPGQIQLTDKKEYPTGDNPISIGIADFNGDGKPDIVAVNNNSHSISVYRNVSTRDSIRFGDRKDFAVGNWPQRLTVGDFDGDGKPDVAVANFNDTTFSVLRNVTTAATISFAPKVNFITGEEPFYLSSGDLDGDGKLEIVVSNSKSANISVYKNTGTAGTIAFADKMDLATGSTPLSSVISDLDGDGKPDLTVVNFHSEYISVFKNNSINNTLLFEQPATYSTGSFSRVATIGDMNGDGQPDISVVNSINNSFYVLTNALRAVPLIKSYTPMQEGTDTVITIIGSSFSGTTGVEIGGISVKTFTATDTLIKATLGDGASGDVVVNTTNGTAVAPGFAYIKPTPVIASFSPASGPAGTLVTIKGKHFGSTGVPVVFFGAVKATVINSTEMEIKVVVPTGATLVPITVTSNARTAYSKQPFRTTFDGTASGLKPSSFKAKKDFTGYSFPRSVATADFDGDGKTDLAITNQASGSASVIRNMSSLNSIELGNKTELIMGAEPFGIATGDFDGDGKTDIAVTNINGGNAGSVSISRNTSSNGSMSFAESKTLAAGNGPIGVAVADLNADGKPDLIVAAGNSGAILLFKNKSDSTGHIAFEAPITLAASNHSDRIIVTEIDGDGKPDLVTADFSSASMSVWRNIGSYSTLSFSQPVSFTAGTQPVALCAADFNNDGKTDITVANYGSNTISIFTNNSITGNISFDEKQDYETGEYPRHLATDDIDGDGITDIVVSCDKPSAVSVFKNNSSSGKLSFAEPVAYATGFEPLYISSADLDGDSKPELIAPNLYSSIAILHNQIDVPVITSFSPGAAKKDSAVIIKGESFSSTSAVLFGNIPAASFVIMSDSVIKATLDTGATGTVQVITPYGNDTKAGFHYIFPAPVITTFKPATGTVGTTVRIVGENFNKTEAVYFGDMPAGSFTILSDTLIQAVVGMGQSGKLIVANRDESDTASGFTFIPPIPVITSFNPTAGEKGTLVTIKGKNLLLTTEVRFGNIKAASFTAITDTTISALLGTGGTGFVEVENNFGNDTLGTFVYLQAATIIAYPNPSVGSALIAHPATNGQGYLKLIDINGRVIKTIAVVSNEAQTKIDLNGIKGGIYRVVWTDGKSTLSQSILVQ